MNDKIKVLERLRQTIPRLAPEFIAERRLDELGADSIDMVELLVVIDSDFGVRLKRMNSCDSSPSMTCFS